MKVRISVVKAIFCGIGIVACTACGEGGSAWSPTSPTGLTSSSPVQSAVHRWSALDESSLAEIKVPEGISCPSDAPTVIVTGHGSRVDIDWSPIQKVSGYEVAIEQYTDTNTCVLIEDLNIAGSHLEWRGREDSRYRVRVRSFRCGNTGQWSAYHSFIVDELSPAPPPMHESPTETPDENPEEEPACTPSSEPTGESWRGQSLPPCDWTWGDERVRR